MERGGKYGHPKVRDVKRSNEYGGRHRAPNRHPDPQGSKESLIDDLLELYEIGKRMLKSPEVEFFRKLDTIEAKDPTQPTPPEGKKAINYLLKGMNDIIKKHSGLDPHIPQVEDSGMLMKATQGIYNHNQETQNEIDRLGK
ncbi:hypothetical protein [Geobacter sp.]|uniref:hypothetical protein n=1 Tax=Geobacter sp. TaxID=46610 RepID=UPI001AC43C02|nr:hypothetical protein [Geobacter sp.]CAG0952226.1 hypothetical protein ANRL4_00146 [Anaerolineae bacterium]